MNTLQLLDAVKTARGLTSDYQLCKLLGWPTSRVTGYRNHGRRLGDDAAIEIADILGIDRGAVLAGLAAERADDDTVRAAWERAAARLSVAVSATLALWLGGLAMPGGDALAAYAPAPILRIMTSAIELQLLPLTLGAIAWAFLPQLATVMAGCTRYRLKPAPELP
jgi:hypothetical protein